MTLIRYTQTAVASFGPTKPSECGLKPWVFTRLTPEVLNWVKTVAGMEYHPGINDPGDMLIVQHHSVFIDHIISAVLITGGDDTLQSAEVYHSDISCVIPIMPDRRWAHTQDGSLVCGGHSTRRSCRRWNPDTGAWDLVTQSLTEDRGRHTSWTPADGSVTYLMGGFGRASDKTSEIVEHDTGRVSASFSLKHST